MGQYWQEVAVQTSPAVAAAASAQYLGQNQHNTFGQAADTEQRIECRPFGQDWNRDGVNDNIIIRSRHYISYYPPLATTTTRRGYTESCPPVCQKRTSCPNSRHSQFLGTNTEFIIETRKRHAFIHPFVCPRFRG